MATGAFELYDVGNNHITNAAWLGTVGSSVALVILAAVPVTACMDLRN
jgi:hypothetical protein